ncbi:MAG TPA: T9SS type A sorting domain-containing protein, partial [Luteibaculaceae bacterium]|nr:T9SS type A sorting domain-containing protein [Luteibaculaceae bacterium]
IYSLLSVFSLLGLAAQAQQIQAEMAKNVIESPAKPRVSYNKSAAFWTNGFENPSDWTLEADDATHGWVITNTELGWSPTSAIVSTGGGNYALFRNGNPTLPAGDPNSNLPGKTWSMTTTNPIDLTNLPNAAVTYEVWGRRFTDDLELQVSTDGVTFTTIEQISSNVRPLTSAQPVNDLTNPTLRYALASAIGGQSQVWIRFRWFSTDTRNIAYSYQVDDVSIIEAPAKELAITDVHFDFGAVLSSFAYREMPLTQASAHEYEAGVFIKNNGALAQDVTVTINVTKDGAPFGTYTGTSTGLAAAASDTVLITLFTPTAIGKYELNVTIEGSTADQETNLNDNEDSDLFYVTDAVYADDANPDQLWTGSFFNAFGTAPNYIAVAPCQVIDVKTTGSTAFSLTTVFPTGTNPPTPGQLLYFELYRFNNAAEFASGFTKDQMTLVADREYELLEEDIYSNASQKYATIYFNTPAALDPGFYVAIIDALGGTDVIYNMPVFAQSNRDGSGGLRGAIQNGASETAWTLYNNVSPFIKLNTSEAYPTLGVTEAQVMNFELGQNVPNPFNGATAINYNLKEAGVVALNITDVTGKTIVSENFGTKGAGSYTYNVDAKNLNSGVYFYSLSVNGKKVTKKMVISE